MPWIGAVASVAGSLLSSDSAGDASGAQGDATAAAVAEQKRQYDVNRGDLKPYREAGGAAVNRLSQLLGIGARPSATAAKPYNSESAGYTTVPEMLASYNRSMMRDHGMTIEQSVAQGLTSQADYQKLINGFTNQAQQAANPQTPAQASALDADYGSLTKKFTLADFWDDPVTKASYQQGLDQGTKMLTNTAARAGNLHSGATLKALARFGTDYTGNQAGQSQARYVNDQTNLYNRLAGVAGTGQTAANTTVAAGSNTANTIGGLISAQGNARGAAAISGGNAMAGGLTNAANNYQQQNTLNQILNRGGINGGNYSGGSFQPFYSMSSDNYG